MRGWLSARVLMMVLALAGCGGGGSASSPESPPPAPTPQPVGLSDQSLTQNRDAEFAEIVWSFFAARLP